MPRASFGGEVEKSELGNHADTPESHVDDHSRYGPAVGEIGQRSCNAYSDRDDDHSPQLQASRQRGIDGGSCDGRQRGESGEVANELLAEAKRIGFVVEQRRAEGWTESP